MFRYRPLRSFQDLKGRCPLCYGDRTPLALRVLCAAIILVGIAFGCYLMRPHKPTLCFTVGYPNTFSASISKVSVSVPFNVSVANPNYYGLLLQHITVGLVHKSKVRLSDTKSFVTLSTFSGPSLYLRARGNSTSTFVAIMGSSSATVSSDIEIVKECAASGKTTFYVNAAVTMLKWVHVAIPNQPITIKCSVSAFSVAKLLPDSQSHSNYFCNTP